MYNYLYIKHTRHIRIQNLPTYNTSMTYDKHPIYAQSRGLFLYYKKVWLKEGQLLVRHLLDWLELAKLVKGQSVYFVHITSSLQASAFFDEACEILRIVPKFLWPSPPTFIRRNKSKESVRLIEGEKIIADSFF